MIEGELRCCISGSFDKFKREIDLVIQEFQDLGVTVLAPEKGWVYIPRLRVLTLSERQFRPLPSERGMPIREIENEFLRSVSRSNFLYIANIEGYTGNSVNMEIGFAIGLGIPVYSREKILLSPDLDLGWRNILGQIKVAAPVEVMSEMR